MDINCVNQCYYQRDGKCTLNEIDNAVCVRDHGTSSKVAFSNQTAFSHPIYLTPTLSKTALTMSAFGAFDTDCPYFTGESNVYF